MHREQRILNESVHKCFALHIYFVELLFGVLPLLTILLNVHIQESPHFMEAMDNDIHVSAHDAESNDCKHSLKFFLHARLVQIISCHATMETGF